MTTHLFQFESFFSVPANHTIPLVEALDGYIDIHNPVIYNQFINNDKISKTSNGATI
jgi:hypothetical protein